MCTTQINSQSQIITLYWHVVYPKRKWEEIYKHSKINNIKIGKQNLVSPKFQLSKCIIARADPSQDHSRALQTAINRLPTDWHRRRGRPRRTWLRTIESDLQPTNLGLTRRGFAHKIVPNGVQLWRRLCSPLGVPPDDDDEVHYKSNHYEYHAHQQIPKF